MPQNPSNHEERLALMRAAIRAAGLRAVVLEPGPAMQELTGVRWGRSERTFALVLLAEGAPVWVVPGFEEMRAKEMIPPGGEVRVWQEDESPFRLIAEALGGHGAAGRVAINEDARFFVFDGIRQLTPGLEWAGFEARMRALGQAPGTQR